MFLFVLFSGCDAFFMKKKPKPVFKKKFKSLEDFKKFVNAYAYSKQI